MNPFVTATATKETNNNTDLKELKEYAWDFIHNCFIYDENNNIKVVIGNEALKVWICKALKTERYRYESYKHGFYNESNDFGVELEQFIGKNKNNLKTANSIKRFIKECLEVNPYITKINSIDITEIDGDKLTFNVDLTSIYGKLLQEVTL